MSTILAIPRKQWLRSASPEQAVASLRKRVPTKKGTPLNLNEGSFLLSAARYVGIDLGERVQIELVRWCLGPAGQEAFGIRMGINRFDALDGATTFQKRTHRIIQLLLRAGSSTFDFESSEGVLVKVGHGVNSGYNSYAGPKPRAEEREGWDGSSIPRIWARRA
ncbi:MAG TPA: hypothetical protein EYG15_12620 [Deltaproteobacteria bacterium]|nr:hypothetical protein [Deltaproteobacteria bacterium]